MCRILVTGALGQLGSEIRKQSELFGQSYFFTDVDELDLCSGSAVEAFLASNPVEYIINCAAYTQVDLAESEPGKAMQVNRDSVAHLRKASEKAGSPVIIHISTDYVYRDNKRRPLIEEDETGPLGIYGKSKLEGEKALAGYPEALVIRTSWLYSTFGNNFVKSMIGLMNGGEQLSVVDDQVGSPTCAKDLARAILSIITGISERKQVFVPGIYNYSNEGSCSWYEFALEIGKMIGFKGCILPIRSEDYPRPAPRPSYSVLNKNKIKKVYGITIPHWLDSLAKSIDEFNITRL